MANELENASLKSRLEKLEAQVNLHLNLKKDVWEEKSLELQVEMASKLKIIKRLKCRAALYRQEIANKEMSLKKMEEYIKTIWNMLLVFGNELKKVGKLGVNEKNQLHNEYKKLSDMGIAQNKGEPHIFDILEGLPVSSLEILNSSEKCDMEVDLEFDQIIDQEKKFPSSSCSTSALFSPKNIASSSDEANIKIDATSDDSMPQILFNEKDASFYPCSSDPLNHENSSFYRKEVPSSVPSHQPISLTGTLFNAEDFSSQHSNSHSNSNIASFNTLDKINCINDEVEESLEQQLFVPGDCYPPAEIMEPQQREASQDKTSNEALPHTFAKESSSTVFEDEQKLPTKVLSVVENCSLEQLTDSSDSNNLSPCRSVEVDTACEGEVIRDMHHDKDDESLQQSFIMVGDNKSYTENIEDLFGNISDEGESEADFSTRLTEDIENDIPQKIQSCNDFAGGECSLAKQQIVDIDMSNDSVDAPEISNKLAQQVVFQNGIFYRNEDLVDAENSFEEHSREDFDNEENVPKEVVFTNKLAGSVSPTATPFLVDLALSVENSDTELNSDISEVPQDSLHSDHDQIGTTKCPNNNSYSLRSICNKNRNNSSCNVEEHNLDSSSAQGSSSFLHNSEEKDGQAAQKPTLPPAKKLKLSKSLPLISLQKKATVDPNSEPETFTCDSNLNDSNLFLSENDIGSKNSDNLNLNKSCSENEETEFVTPPQQTRRSKRRLGRIFTFYINNDSSKQRKSAFVAGVPFKTSQWNTKFKKVNEQLKNDASLQVSSVDRSKLSKNILSLKQYSGANRVCKLHKSEKSTTIKNSELEVNSESETQREASISKDTPTGSKVTNCVKYNPNNKHSVDQNQIVLNGSDKEVVEGSYITYVKSKNVDLGQSNQNKQTIKKKRERVCTPPDQIKQFFHNYNEREFTPLNFKYDVQMLVKKFQSSRFFPSTSELLFHTLTHLSNSKKNPLLTYSIHEDSAVKIPLDENCIVTALFTIESRHLPHLEGLQRRALTTIHHLILSKKKLGIFSLGALCRVLVEICKRQENSQKPVILCADLLKMRHPFATYLIASIAAVWKELFMIEKNLPAEERLFHSSILYGACNGVKHLSADNKDASLNIISNFLTAPIVNCAKSAIAVLKNLIEMRCQDDSWNSHYLTSALVILARHEDWDWIQDNLMTNFIIPNLNKFGRETLNEHAFDIFCNLYVDVFLLKPGNPLDVTLSRFFNNSEMSEGEDFVKECAALALIRFVYLKNRQLPPFLDSWFQDNKHNPKVQQIECLFRRKKMGEDLKFIRMEDIL